MRTAARAQMQGPPSDPMVRLVGRSVFLFCLQMLVVTDELMLSGTWTQLASPTRSHSLQSPTAHVIRRPSSPVIEGGPPQRSLSLKPLDRGHEKFRPTPQRKAPPPPLGLSKIEESPARDSTSPSTRRGVGSGPTPAIPVRPASMRSAPSQDASARPVLLGRPASMRNPEFRDTTSPTERPLPPQPVPRARPRVIAGANSLVATTVIAETEYAEVIQHEVSTPSDDDELRIDEVDNLYERLTTKSRPKDQPASEAPPVLPAVDYDSDVEA
eukprot:m.450672 g.450672  ORF g.450672 m.450672 type:complete len:270 (-) comp56909_c0_seq39:821-1630(-)